MARTFKVTAGLLAATLSAALVGGVSANYAKAADVFWGHQGYGWVTSNGSNVYAASRDIDVDVQVTTDPYGGRTIRYGISFNKNFRTNGFDTFSGRPWLYVYLPQGLNEETVRIDRYRMQFNPSPFAKDKYYEATVAKSQTISQFNDSNTRRSGLYPESTFQEHWNNGVGQTDLSNTKFPQYPSTSCELVEWKDQGKFWRSLWSYEADSNTQHRWVITAQLKPGADPEKMPVLAGFNSSNTVSSKEDRFMAYGPFDTDHDGLTNIEELHRNTNPFSPDLNYELDNQPVVYGKLVKASPFLHTGENHNAAGQHPSTQGWYFLNTGKTKELQPGIRFYAKRVPAGVSETISKTPAEGQYFLDQLTGEFIYNPRRGDVGKDLDFELGASYRRDSVCVPEKHDQTKLTLKQQKLNNYLDPEYENLYVMDGEVGKSKVPTHESKELPKGTRFWFDKTSVNSDGKPKYSYPFWAEVDEKTGMITAKPPAGTHPAGYKVPVIATYPDGTEDVINAHIFVQKYKSGKGEMQLDLSQNELSSMPGLPLSDTIKIAATQQRDRRPIVLRMACVNEQTNAVSIGGGNGLWLNNDKDSSSYVEYEVAGLEKEIKFLQSGQREPGLIYSKDRILAKTTSEIYGSFENPGKYKCAVFSTNNPGEFKKFKLNPSGHLSGNDAFLNKKGIEWESKTFTVDVSDRFSLPKTGGIGAALIAGLIALGCAVGLSVTAYRMNKKY
ncbi:MAG: Rib/alpha-like domain-containing protein [Winkia neuii]|nr:Rib/alpha-like domain-containing protein [Winkia neuii]MDK8100009.1 Rib/alpha-like domain-containing protein [Winkia neuii]MDU3135019.1 Rib/alpha-like domain-containing protein [Winkia neuii]